GAAVSISGGNIAVGAPGRASSQGAVYVFTGGGAIWSQNTILTSSRGSAGDQFGYSVSIQGFTVAVGAPFSAFLGRAAAGGAFVFASQDSGAHWQQFNLALNRGQSRAGDHFGSSIALSGNTVVAGSPNDQIGNRSNNGSAQVFINTNGLWSRQTRLNVAGAGFLLGSSAALYSNTLVLGAPGAVNGRGSAYVFTRSGTSWSTGTPLPVTGAATGDHFGASVAISGTTIVAGAPNANANGGAAFVFDLVGPVYTQLNTLVATDNAGGDTFGASVSLDAGRAVVGAPLNSNSSATGNGEGYVFLVGKTPTTTTISSVVPEPSALGQLYTVNVQVATDPASLNVPTGTVDIFAPFGVSCLGVALDGTGAGSCQLTSANTGFLSITANYSGDTTFAASSATPYQHHVIGFSFVFIQQPADVTALDDVPQGNRLSGVTVQEFDDTDTLVSTDNTTQVQLSLPDPCNLAGSITFGPVTVVGGIADFTDVGPRFYTQTSGGLLQLTANATNATVSPATSTVFDVVAPPPEFLFSDGFESCRL
ncbi:MAG TPA: Ig-like domain repeat protein, partial [Rudaea sp.]|nr:Ig-like domain repeat protein [Rudaea sp.]